MSRRTKVRIGIAVAVLAGPVYWGIAVARHGFSAREKPWRVEEFFARHARKIAIPAGAKGLTNPYPATPERSATARDHWVEHCAGCHALDGRGDTVIGRNLYPKATDLGEAGTQRLSDGELFYVINNGIRFTGMPAWGDSHSAEEIWQLVSFLRRLPTLSPEEIKAMQERVAPPRGEMETHSHEPGTKEHAHHR